MIQKIKINFYLMTKNTLTPTASPRQNFPLNKDSPPSTTRAKIGPCAFIRS